MLGLLLMRFDGTITLGDLGVIVTFIVATFSAYNRLSIAIAELRKDVAMVVNWYENCTKGDCPVAKEVRLQRKYNVEES